MSLPASSTSAANASSDDFRDAVAKSMSRVARPSGMRASSPLPPLRMNRPSGSLNTLHRNRSRKAWR